jgi:hypothetical protein
MEDVMRNHLIHMLALFVGSLLIVACPNQSDNPFGQPDGGGGTLVFDSGPDQGEFSVDSGAGLPCCPAAFNLYGCQKANGGTGFACHDPSRGCESSQMCGQSCDPEVSGRCQCVETVLCIMGDHFDDKLCKCVPNQDGAVSPPVDAGTCVETVLCIMGDHFDNKLCKCVPNQDGAVSPPVDAGTCVETVLCIMGDHFDNKLCKCVPNQDGAVSPPVDAGTCVETVLCIMGDHFDNKLCKCVPNQDGPTRPDGSGGLVCASAMDCTGALPDLCQICSDGGTGCAHFTCVANKCQVAYCP